MNIYQKMAAITAELQTVAKNLTVQQTQKSSYKAVAERDVLDAVKPLEEKYGVYSYAAHREVLESNLLDSESEYNGKVTKKTTFMSRIKTVYRFVNTDKPDEYIDTITFAEGIDSQDKGSGKAMTYGDKYALMKAYKISTGEDPDQEEGKEEHYTQTQRKPAAGLKQKHGGTLTEDASALLNAKRRLISAVRANGLDEGKYVAEKGLTSNTTIEEIEQLLVELGQA